VAIPQLRRVNPMERKEPHASEEEFKKRVVRYRDIPFIELGPGAKAHLVCAEKMTVSFITQEPNCHFPTHHHEPEEIVIVLEGERDELVEGKLYHIKVGDVLIVPSGIEHGSYTSDRGCKVVEVFSPPRKDLIAKLEKVLSC